MHKAHEITKVGRVIGGGGSMVLVKAVCSECGYTTISPMEAAEVTLPSGIIDDHLKQHVEQGRAPDIEIDWTISAECSVCDDGGSIDLNDIDTIICHECLTTWTIDGTDGELDE